MEFNPNPNKYTETALKAVSQAKDLAQSNSNYNVGTEHLMYALIKVSPLIRQIVQESHCDISQFKNLAMKNYDDVIDCNEESIEYSAVIVELLSELEENVSESHVIETMDIFKGLIKNSYSNFYTCTNFLIDSGTDMDMLNQLCKKSESLLGTATKETSKRNFNKEKSNSSKPKKYDFTEELMDIYTIPKEDADNICKYAQNMNLRYLKGKYDKCSMRDNEINRICEILLRKNKNNPVLIGKAGVGKTAIVEGLVEKIVKLKREELNGGNHHPLADKIIYNLNLTSAISGTKYRGDFEERIQKILNTVTKNPNIILFIDEIHMIMGLNNSTDCQGTVSLSQMLKQPLSRGDISVIGATTEYEYQMITQDKAMDRRFSPVKVQEFTKKQMTELLSVIAKTYEDYHKVTIPKQVMTAALKYSNDYYTERVYPDKLIDIIDETASRIRLNNYDKDKITMTEEDVKKTVMNQLGILIIE